MSRVVFLLLAWSALGLELGLRELLRIPGTRVHPSFVLVLVAGLGMMAPASASGARWGALFLGLLLDLVTPLPLRDMLGDVRIVGPWVLACAASVEAALLLRSSATKRTALSLGLHALVCAAAAQCVIVIVMTVRSIAHGGLAWSFWSELLPRAGCALATGALGVVLGVVALPALARMRLIENGPGVSSGRAARY